MNGKKYLKSRDIDNYSNFSGSTKVTIVIPFRDATEELLLWLNAFEKVKYAENAEILLINDGSVNSLLKLRKRVPLYPNVRLIDRSHQGKKKAIEVGVKLASNDIIICTDADTVPQQNWIAGILACFDSEQVQMVCGRVVPSRGYWLAQIDFLALMAASEVLIKKKLPVMCSGSHMAFRKSAFKAVEGYTGYWHFKSGDDVILLHKIKAHFGGQSIVFNDFFKANVLTAMPDSVGRFLIQRQRWGGKAVYYRDTFSKALAFTVLYCAIMTYASFPIFWNSAFALGISAALISIKILTDVILIKAYANESDVSLKTSQLTLAVLLYPVYIAIVFVRILLNPNPRW
ncbi:glycosyltransferase [Thermaurantimonas aggregans]|uniref:glycosyltransferase n=1 Tax=Thermaurantimonas aggregans TaxID=2173829 RepID=UPI0023EFF829|nr:glycosyltransferase [Thermaurantimonas aggregans]MCX8147768.1 glycosyltransferase [Thermaurantimonas aggregans]